MRVIFTLVLIAMGIGIYLIASTVMITKDGVFYIESARFILDPNYEVLTDRPAGFELLILLAHTIWEKVTGELTFQQQIWVAQSFTLGCRIITIVLLYLLGRNFAGRKAAFWGCVILLVLPRPAHWGSDPLREWPNLMLLSAGFLSLFYGAQKNRPWYLGGVGLCVGLACLIRIESAQVIVTAVAVGGFMIFRATEKRQRLRWCLGILLMLVCFAVPKLVYGTVSGQYTSKYLKQYLNKAGSAVSQPDTDPSEPPVIDVPVRLSNNSPKPPTKPTVTGFVQAVFDGLGDLFVWFLFPFWIIGTVQRLRNRSGPVVRIMIGSLMLTSFGLVFLRYWVKEPTLSMRWFLPLIGLTSYYAYGGIEQIARWAASRRPESKLNFTRWCQILTFVGIAFCIPNLMERSGSKRRVLLDTAHWIRENSEPTDWLYTFDRRVGFYAERPYRPYEEDVGIIELFDTKYLVTTVKDQQPPIELPDDADFERSFKNNGREVWVYRREPKP